MNALRLGMLLVALAAAGCGPSAPLEVTTIQLGKAINPDSTVSTFTTRFKPTDTIYVVMLTPRPGVGTFNVKWLVGTRVVFEATRRVSYTDAAATEFHLQNTAGFPDGAYRVEVFLNGTSIGTRDYRVESGD